ncbi:MAG: FprA family A-type flavoprotein [Spirochaetes bacterium]|nr:FprA family A-type flavoprotein [Spirochaetota bacterium]
MKAEKIKDNIYWVGGIDWGLRNFHGYITQRGSTYNAYLIMDEKITLIDTAKYYLVDEMLERISSIVDPAKIDVIVSNHVEMDHSGGLPRLMEICPNATLITSPNGEKGLKAHYKKDWDFHVVKSGDSFSLGKRSLNFLLTPMVHWPDNMLSYMPEEKILFSNDSFGQHLACSERFDDQYPLDIIMVEAKKYYANIVLPYSAQVQKELAEASKLDIQIVCPSHGIIWRSHIPEIVECYKQWSSNQTVKKALIIYDTMWNSTKSMAYAVMDAFSEKGYATRLMDLNETHISDIMTEVIDSEYICVGSPTLNNHLLPTVAEFLTYLKGLSPKKRKAVAFGSFGWGGQSVSQVESYLSESGFDVEATFKHQYVPDKKYLKQLTEELKTKIS